jgi:7,8-dihydropterin-6-yl-methyl-4-(beta-D-ribofuranosyl)aminobenzene 5'-phosphate synthase
MRCILPFTLLVMAWPAAGAGVEIRVIYDNTSARSDMEADWGFAAVVTTNGHRVLFDSGTKPDLFLENLRKMEVRPDSIQAAVISHEHEDHRNGIYRLHPLYSPMLVHFLETFNPQAFAEAVSVGLQPRRINGPEEIVPGIFTTGIVAGKPDEQALVIPTEKGLVILTGCSHPGVVKMVEAARRSKDGAKVRLLLGGFHLFQTSEPEIAVIVDKLKAQQVERVVPAHCTGDPAMKALRRAYGDNYSLAGAGKIIQLD